MRVSFLRTLRVGDHAGEPIEDLGVAPEIPHNMTQDDLLHGNRDLIESAGQVLAQGTARRFEVELFTLGQTMTMELTSENVTSVDVFVNGRPVIESTRVSNGPNSIDFAKPAAGAHIRIEGYRRRRLVAARVIDLA